MDFATQTFSTVSSQASSQGILQQKRALDTYAKAGALDPKTLDKIDKASKEYEQVFLSEMLDLMFKDVSMDPLNKKDGSQSGTAQDIYKQFMVKEYATALTERGGIGLASHIRAQLIDLQSSANAKSAQ